MSDFCGDLRDATRMAGEVTSEPEAKRTRERKTAPVRGKRVMAEARILAVQLLEGKGADPRSLAQTLGVTTRTLQNWTEQSRTQVLPKCLGRPSYSEALVAATTKAIDELQDKTPRPLSWRMARQALGTQHPTFLIQRIVSARKHDLHKRAEAHREEHRVHHEIVIGDAVWAQDATHLDRDPKGAAIQAEVLTDPASSLLLQAVAGPPATDERIAALLESTFLARGAPLVFQTDNGSAYTGPAVRALLRLYKVVHLRNLPRTPQHNPKGERANGLLKETLGIRRGDAPRQLPTHVWQGCLGDSQEWMNTAFPRPRLGGKTPAHSHKSLAPWYTRICRGDFYAAARSAVARAVKSHENPRERRRAVRAAIQDTMESFGILRRTRGRARIPIPRCEIIS